jgi:hypothetical protein
MIATPTIAQEISDRFGLGRRVPSGHARSHTHFWVAKDRAPALLRFLKEEIDRPYKMLYDLSAIDERMRVHRQGSRPAILRLSIICFLLTGTSMSASRWPSPKTAFRCRASRTSGPPRIGTSAKCGTCSESSLTAIRIWNAS